jgi:opacity protein-like surface antigen
MKRVIHVVLSSVALIGAPSVASADWIADIRFNYAITSDVGGTDQDIGDDSEIVTFNGDGIEGSSGFGFAVGKRFDNMGVSLAYESMGVTYDLSGSVQANGTVQLPGTDSDYDVDTFMLEIDYTGQINEAFDWNVLAGIGQTTFDFGANGISIPRADGTVAIVGEPSDNSDTSMRIGAGIGYKLSETATLLTMLQYTNYGTAESKIGTGANQTTLTMDVEATELSMRVRFDF